MWYFGFRVNSIYYNSVIYMQVFFVVNPDTNYKRYDVMFYKLVLL